MSSNSTAVTLTKKDIAAQIAKLQEEMNSAPDPQPSDVVMGTQSVSNDTPDTPVSSGSVSDKEQAIDVAVQTAGAVAGKFIHSADAVNTLAAVTGMAPVFVHLGLFFASLFHHHAQTQGFTQQQ